MSAQKSSDAPFTAWVPEGGRLGDAHLLQGLPSEAGPRQRADLPSYQCRFTNTTASADSYFSPLHSSTVLEMLVLGTSRRSLRSLLEMRLDCILNACRKLCRIGLQCHAHETCLPVGYAGQMEIKETQMKKGNVLSVTDL